MMKQYFVLLPLLLWAGCIVAISFMESWLKFKAPGVTLPVGLGIGKLVFSALNKMEWFFAVAAVAGFFVLKQSPERGTVLLFAAAVFLLVAQTFWLLPALDARATGVISGATLAPSNLHWYFVGAEIIKFSLLLILGYALLKQFATA